MLFVGFAIAIAIVLALAVSLDFGAIVGLGQADTGQMIFLVILLVFLASSLFSRRIRGGEILQGAAIWLVLILVAVGGYSYRYEFAGVANRVFGEIFPEQAVISSDGQIATFRRGLGSSFVVQTQVNGSNLRMIFDTGASAVVLSFEDARRAGIDVDNLRYTVPVQTANGQSMAASVRLKDMSVGGIARRNIPAFVAAPGLLETSLLGMSYLETLSGYSVSQNSLELRG